MFSEIRFRHRFHDTCLYLHFLYTSSIKSTPRIALSIISWVFKSVSPIWLLTSLLRSHSTTLFYIIIPMSYSIFAINLATEILPVPGFPVNTTCIEEDGILSSFSYRQYHERRKEVADQQVPFYVHVFIIVFSQFLAVYGF